MAEFIDIRLSRAAVALAITLGYSRAAKSLGIPESELRGHVKTLGDLLYVHLFDLDSESAGLTDGGRFLLQEIGALLTRQEQREVKVRKYRR